MENRSLLVISVPCIWQFSARFLLVLKFILGLEFLSGFVTVLQFFLYTYIYNGIEATRGFALILLVVRPSIWLCVCISGWKLEGEGGCGCVMYCICVRMALASSL
jgi:hypothetical protein